MQLKELSVNTAQVLQLNRKLEEQLASANKKQQASTKDCQALRADLKAAHDLTEEANTLLTEQERSASAQLLLKGPVPVTESHPFNLACRNQNSLQQQLTAAKVRATKAEQSSSQAQTAKSKSEMAHKALQSELADLRKQLAHFQAGLKSVEQRQKVRRFLCT